MTAQELKNSILQLAIQGKLVPQDPNDEPATVLLEKIKEERNKLIKEKKIKKEKYSEIYKDETDNHYYEKFEDGTINDITDDIPFEIPRSWSWCRIGNFEEINLGFTYKPDYTEDGVYFLSVKDISGGKIDFSKAKKVSQKTYDNASYGSKPRKGDILFGRVGTMGKPQIIETDIPFCIFVSLGFFRDHFDLINKKYICLWMESFLFQQQVNINVKGAAQKNLNTGWLKNFLIPLPPLNEQERIVNKFITFEDVFDKYDKAYNILEKLNNSYKEELKKSILQYAIQGKLMPQNSDDEDADILIQKVLAEKRKLIKEKQIKKENLSVIYKDDTDNQFYEKFDDGTIINITDEIPFDIPENWAWTRLCNVLEIARGGSPRPIQAYLTEADNGVNWIKIGDTEKGGKYINSTKEKIIPEGMKKSRFVKKGDFILSNSMSFGRPYILNIDGCVHDGWLVFSNVDTCFFKDYLYYLLSSNFVYSQFCSRVSGAVVNNLNSDKVKSTLIPLPPLTEQKQIALSIESFFNILADT